MARLQPAATLSGHGKGDDAMILVSYDGSADAQTAIDHAAQLTPGGEATVLTVWEPALADPMGLGEGLAGAYIDDAETDAASQQTVLARATDGAQRASAAGLVAEGRIAGQHGGIARAILAVAADVDADLIVLGTRGMGGMKSFLLGSVSHEVVQHADRAVLVVPSAGIVEQRRGWALHSDAERRRGRAQARDATFEGS